MDEADNGNANVKEITEWIFTIRNDENENGNLNYPSKNFYVTVEGEKIDDPLFSYHSTRIEERIKRDHLKTLQGNLFILRQPISVLFGVLYGYPVELMQKFENGFPSDWLQLITDFYADKIKRGFVSDWDKLEQNANKIKAGRGLDDFDAVPLQDPTGENNQGAVQEVHVYTKNNENGDQIKINADNTDSTTKEIREIASKKKQESKSPLKKKADRVYRFDPAFSETSTAPVKPFGKPETSKKAETSILNTTRYGRLVKPRMSGGDRIVYDVYGNPVCYERGQGDDVSSVNIYQPTVDITELAERLNIKSNDEYSCIIGKDKLKIKKQPPHQPQPAKSDNKSGSGVKRKQPENDEVDARIRKKTAIDPKNYDQNQQSSKVDKTIQNKPKGWESPDANLFRSLYEKEKPKNELAWKKFTTRFADKTVNQCIYFARKYCNTAKKDDDDDDNKKDDKQPVEVKKSTAKNLTDKKSKDKAPEVGVTANEMIKHQKPNDKVSKPGGSKCNNDDFFHSGVPGIGLIKIVPIPADNLSSATTPHSLASESRFYNNDTNHLNATNLDETNRDYGPSQQNKQSMKTYVNQIQRNKPKKILKPAIPAKNLAMEDNNRKLKKAATSNKINAKVNRLFDNTDKRVKQLKRLQRIVSDEDESDYQE